MNERGRTLDSRAALDALFRAHVARDPDGLALADPPDMEGVTGKKPQTLSYAELDTRIETLAALLRELGIPEGGTVAIQLPNNADSVIALLAVARAGLVPALLPLLWRRAECAAALARVHAKAILCCGRVGDFDHGQLALELAAQLFPVRAVCGFGHGLADGIVPIDEMTRARRRADPPDFVPEIAAVTFDIAGDGPIAVERNAVQLLAAGLLIGGHAGITRGARLVSTLPIASYAGLAGVLVPWLMGGGALQLHHPFSPDILRRQIERGDILVVPDAIAQRLADVIPPGGKLRAVVSLCRSPERFASAPVWTQPDIALVDVAAFGETALLAAQRATDGEPTPWPLRIRPPGSDNEIARLQVTPAGTLAIHGVLSAASEGFPDGNTGYSCLANSDGIVVTAAPAGIANVGGYRFAMRDLQDTIRTIEGGAVLAALPHSITGHRLAGHAGDPQAMRHMLDKFGFGPLVAGAFRDRPARQ